MIQQTSIDAYHNIRTNGLLSKRRFEVFDQIYQRGPITLNRLIEILYKPGRNTSSISARLSELQRHDVIEADGTVKASTGNTVTLWKATGRLPKKLIRKKPELKTLRDLVQKARVLAYKIEGGSGYPVDWSQDVVGADLESFKTALQIAGFELPEWKSNMPGWKREPLSEIHR